MSVVEHTKLFDILLNAFLDWCGGKGVQCDFVNVYRYGALLAPLVVGLMVPAIWAWAVARQFGAGRRILYPLAGFGGFSLVLLVLNLLCGEDLWKGLQLVLFLLVFAAMPFSVCEFLRALHISAAFGQVVSSLFVVLLVGTVFYWNPLIEQAEAGGESSAEIGEWADAALAYNPYVVIAHEFLGMNVLHGPWMYRFSALAQQVIVFNPTAARAMLGYGIFSAVMLILAMGLRKLWRPRT